MRNFKSNRNTFARAALLSAFALAFSAPALAQGGGGSNSMQTSPQTKHGTASAVPTPSGTGVTGDTSMSGKAMAAPLSTSRSAADNSNSKSGPGVADDWVNSHATQNKGRVSRQAYMDEMGRRFDTMDATKRGDMLRTTYLEDLDRQWKSMDSGNRGLTPAEVSRITGKVDVHYSGIARTGSGVQAGNFGPSNVRK